MSWWAEREVGDVDGHKQRRERKGGERGEMESESESEKREIEIDRVRSLKVGHLRI